MSKSGKTIYNNKDYSPKSIMDLMTHMRNNGGIEVQDRNARQLINYGYYHAYKGYRFFKKPKAFIPYASFDEIIAVIDYDNDLKAAFYPQIMFLETALKNIVVARVIEGANNAGFEEIYRLKMSSDEGEGMQQNRRHLKVKIRQTIDKRYNQDNPIIAHFQKRGDPVPIWGIFEVLSLGDFAMFVRCLDRHVRNAVNREIGLVVNTDTECQLLTYVVYTLKDLRNALAHNNVIFDTRFKDREVENCVIEWLSVETGIEDIAFDTIIDYYILIVAVLKRIEYEDVRLKRFFKDMRAIFDELYEKTPTPIYTKLTTSRLMTKLERLEAYIGVRNE